MTEPTCRGCRSRHGHLVLDLGEQPACDHFPDIADPGPDPTYPLQMWLCGSCGLAQLAVDPTVADEPKATEPAALLEQAADAVDRVARAGWLRPGATVLEFGSPHGGSWLSLLQQRGLTVADPGGPADVIIDCFGLMHAADQAAAIAERAARLARTGVLLLQYHSLATIIRHRQWNSLRHGHYAYYSAPSLSALLATRALAIRSAWQFDLYGGTVLLAVTHAGPDARPDPAAQAILDEETRSGIRDNTSVSALQLDVAASATALRSWLQQPRPAGRHVLGYGAASRAVALLCAAGIDATLLPAIADASPAKAGRRMPATDIPIITPQSLLHARPHEILLFLPDLLPEVRRTLPQIEQAGGTWIDIDDVLQGRHQTATT